MESLLDFSIIPTEEDIEFLLSTAKATKVVRFDSPDGVQERPDTQSSTQQTPSRSPLAKETWYSQKDIVSFHALVKKLTTKTSATEENPERRSQEEEVTRRKQK